MKFTDGNWLLQPGVHAHYPTQVHDVVEQDGRLIVHAPTRPIRHRGDTLQGPLLKITLSAPMVNVIKVRLEHFTGVQERGPYIPTFAKHPFTPEIAEGPNAVSLKSGALEARIKRGDSWELAFLGQGKALTTSAPRGMGYIELAGQGSFMHEQLSLGVGECVYGLGERFTAFAKNGQVVENWNKDGGTGSDQAYKAVPFYLTNRGYGVLVNETGPVSFEVASEKVSRVQFSLPGEHLEYYVIFGPSPKDILRNLTALTGRPPLPPAWSFGLWLTTSFTTNYDEKTVTSFIDGMKSRDLPLHVFHFDCFWMREFEWCNFQWDPRTFPDPEGLLRRLHERGLRVCVWINPYIGQRSPLFEIAAKKGYFLKKPNGEVWQNDLWQPGMGIVDFTNPAASAWFTGELRRLLDQGVDCFKTDFGERIPTDVVYHDGSDPVKMHNYYPLLYNEAVFSALEAARGVGDAVVFARSTYASGQRFPIHWGGDCNSTFESMAESLRGGLSLSLCGFGYWSHDIGGFEGLPPAAIYKRWTAFGLLSSHSRLHGSSTYRVPWNYDDEACDVLRFFTKLKCQLMPYLYGKAVEAHLEGIPMLRAMVLEFPDDPACTTLDRQYLLGDALFVAPVLTSDGWVEYYLPAGRWTHLLSGEVQIGGRWFRAHYPFLSLPLFVRPGTILPLGSIEDRPDYEFTDGVTFRIYELDDGAKATCSVPTLKGGPGLILTATRRGTTIEATLDGPSTTDWKIQLIGAKTFAASKNGSVTSHLLGGIATFPSNARAVQLTLSP